MKQNFRLLKHNTSQYDNIEPVYAALWSSDGVINLMDPSMGHACYQVSDKPLDNILHTVKSVTIENLLHQFELEKIDILKVDIEGAEKEIFDHSKNWIEKVDSIIIELHDSLKAGLQ